MLFKCYVEFHRTYWNKNLTGVEERIALKGIILQ